MNPANSQKSEHSERNSKRQCCNDNSSQETHIDLTTDEPSKCIFLPKCPACHNRFDMAISMSNSPVMSMNCCHTICSNCVILHTKYNAMKLKRKVTVCSCPIDGCQAKRSFGINNKNWNFALITFYDELMSQR